jgi:hypothetical protein
MKRIILVLLLAAGTCIFGFTAFSQEPVDPAMADEVSQKGGEAIIIFITIFVVVALILMLRLATEKMKTDKSKNKNSLKGETNETE